MEIRVTNYVDETKHGKIYTSCLDSILQVRKINKLSKFVIPLSGNSWHKYVPNGSRLIRIEDFDVRKELAPSKRLLDSLKHNLLGISEFEMTYALEMEENGCGKSIEELAQESLSGTTLVIFGFAKSGKPCHRYMLGKLIARAVKRVSNSRHRAKLKAYAGELVI